MLVLFSLSVMSDSFATTWNAARQLSLSFTSFQRLLKLIPIESVMPFNHLILCHPLLLPTSIFPSIRVFSNESVLHSRWPKYWSFSFSISPSNEYSGLISFRIDWFDLLAVQRTFKSLLQHHSSKTSILWHSAFFIVQLSHPYLTTGKTIALTRWTFVSKVMSHIFNMLSSLVITFLPRSKSVMSDSFVTPWTVAHQAPLSTEFSRQEHWGGLPLPIPDLPEPSFQPTSLRLLHWPADSLSGAPPGM